MEALFQTVNVICGKIQIVSNLFWDFPTNFDWYANIPILGNFSLAIILLVGTGIYFTFRLRFIQVRKFRHGLHVLMRQKSSGTGISSLASFLLSTAMRVGPGNILGVTGAISTGEGLMASTVAVAFAYEGWILATSINAELRDAKRTLPRALVVGSFIVVLTYILYYIGLTGAVTTEELMASGEAAAKMAFQRVFGETAGTVVFVLIVISCLGTLNGLTLSCCRGMYALAVRNEGPMPELFRQVDPVTNMAGNSALVSLGLSALWLVYFYGANVGGPWFGPFSFDSSELPIITLYGMYVPMFIQFMRKSTDLNPFRRFVMPALALCACAFMVYAAFAGYGVTVLYYLVVYAAVMGIGWLFDRRKK